MVRKVISTGIYADMRREPWCLNYNKCLEELKHWYRSSDPISGRYSYTVHLSNKKWPLKKVSIINKFSLKENDFMTPYFQKYDLNILRLTQASFKILDSRFKSFFVRLAYSCTLQISINMLGKYMKKYLICVTST